MDFLYELDEYQRRAVCDTDGRILVLAGPGSGKTRVVTYKVAYLIAKGVLPRSILCLTFTNKAADEMRKRVKELIGEEGHNVWAGTFHSYCARLLRRYGEFVGVPRNYTIYDEDDERRVIRELIKRYDVNLQVDEVYSQIERAKSRYYDESLIESFLRESEIKCGLRGLYNIYLAYRQTLLRANALDFSDLLVKAVRLLHTKVRKWVSPKYLIVDEFQDTNLIQYYITELLAREYGNVTCVGDEDQSIYGFRGAVVENIFRFKNRGARVYVLPRNYRSTKVIVEASRHVIEKNELHYPKELHTENESGSHIVVRGFLYPQDEAEWVCDEIEQNSYRDACILVRTQAQTRAFEDEFVKRGIPYIIIGTLRFYDRKEIKDILAYLRLVYNKDDDCAFLRACNLSLIHI